MARQLIADPELANKVRDGRLREVRPCIASNACLSHDRSAKPDPVRVETLRQGANDGSAP